MKKTIIPDGDSELLLSNNISVRIYEGIEIADELACQYFEGLGAAVDKWAKPDLFRYLLHQYFRAPGNQVSGVEFETLNKNGVAFTYERRRYRLWKRPSNELPPPGWSQAKWEFLNQIPQQGILFSTDEYLSIQHNLAIIMTENSNHRLRDLYLIYPKEAKSKWEPGKAYWKRRIPHPAELGGLAGLGATPPTGPSAPKLADDIEIDSIQSELPWQKQSKQNG
jgi:hypothetical protein